MALFAVFFPWTRKGKGRSVFFPSFVASLPSTFPKTSTQPTPPHGLPPWWKGQRRQALRAALGWLYRGRPSHHTPSTWLDRGGVAPSLPPLLCSVSPFHFPKNLDTTHTPSWPTTMMKGAEETSPAGSSRVAVQRPPQPPYPFAMTGQGWGSSLSPCPYKYPITRRWEGDKKER